MSGNLKVKLGKNLAVGDIIALGDNGKRNVPVTVLATDALAAPDLFGRVFSAVWARREDTGAEGLVTYGPEGAFVMWDDSMA